MEKIMNILSELLVNSLIETKTSMVFQYQFNTVYKHLTQISRLEGDIVECGIWRGGFLIFLTHLFSNKNIWGVDSFKGFQPLKEAKYQFDGERHTPFYVDTPLGPIGITIEEVKQNFRKYGFDKDILEGRVKFLEGWVKDVLPGPIEKISLLRIDVDSYSATLETLDSLYDKVVPGGIIIFDDSGLPEALEATKSFLISRGLPLQLHHPQSDQMLDLNIRYKDNDSGIPEGCYLVKN
jgi:hypothetical protein